jgi:hypothetical protein
MTPHFGHELAVTATRPPHSGHSNISVTGASAGGAFSTGIGSGTAFGSGFGSGDGVTGLGTGAGGGDMSLIPDGRERISSTLDSILALLGAGGGVAAFLAGSTSMSKMVRSVPQNPHFLEPG